MVEKKYPMIITNIYIHEPIVYVPIAKNMSFTFIAVFAEVSMNRRLFSSAYACASYNQKAEKSAVIIIDQKSGNKTLLQTL